MKAFLRAILFVFFLLFQISSVVLAADNQLITELKVLDTDSSFRYLYIYDNQQNKVLETKYILRNTNWSRQCQTEWYYDGDKCIAQKERTWSNNSWVTQKNIDFVYKNNQLSTETYAVLNQTNMVLERKVEYSYYQDKLDAKNCYQWINNQWQLIESNKFTYDEVSHIDSLQTIVFLNGLSTQQYLFINTYLPDNQLKTQTLKTSVDGKNWTNSLKTIWYYKTGDNKVLAQIKKSWLSEIENWQNLERVDYVYAITGDLLSEVYQHWKMVAWEDDVKYDYEYDATNRFVKKSMSLPIYHQWRKYLSVNYSNFVGNVPNLMESKFEFWGGNTGEFTTSYIPYYFNNELTIQKAKKLEISYLVDQELSIPQLPGNVTDNSLQVYPNPSKGVFYLDTQKHNVKSWELFDLKGNIIKKHLQTENSGVIDITDLDNGIYLLRVLTSTKSYYQKIIKN